MIPETSTTLLKDIANGENARWTEFVARYRPMMRSYMKSHFPAVDADDAVQESLIALSNVISNYRYAPDETGRFRLKQCEKATKERTAKAELKELAEAGEAFGTPDDSDSWKDAVLEIAMRQILDDDKIPDKSKQIFQRLTVDGVSPDEVAAEYGTSRNNVDKTKSRMLARLREIVRSLEEVGNV